MKYIRTKDGRIFENKLTMYVCPEALEELSKCEVGEEIEILKQADTIEELCDEFVVIKKNGDKIITCNYRNIQVYIERKFEIYGAIWTNKGLIYVAKMNNEGELELL